MMQEAIALFFKLGEILHRTIAFDVIDSWLRKALP